MKNKLSALIFLIIIYPLSALSEIAVSTNWVCDIAGTIPLTGSGSSHSAACQSAIGGAVSAGYWYPVGDIQAYGSSSCSYIEWYEGNPNDPRGRKYPGIFNCTSHTSSYDCGLKKDDPAMFGTSSGLSCNALGCETQSSGYFLQGTGSNVLYDMVYTGNACVDGVPKDGSSPVPAPEGVFDQTTQYGDEVCAVINGQTVCTGSTVENRSGCGTFNGQPWCQDDYNTVQPGHCESVGDNGGVMCVSGESSPPAPDNGSIGQPANPDVSVLTPSGTVNNYYSPTTVSNSVSTVGSGGGSTGGGDSGGGSTGGDSGGATASEIGEQLGCEGDDCQQDYTKADQSYSDVDIAGAKQRFVDSINGLKDTALQSFNADFQLGSVSIEPIVFDLGPLGVFQITDLSSWLDYLIPLGYVMLIISFFHAFQIVIP